MPTPRDVTRRGLRRLAWCVFVAFLAFVHACVTPATVVVVDMGSDAPSGSVVRVSVAAFDEADAALRWTDLGDGGPVTLPASFGIRPGPTSNGRAGVAVDVTVTPPTAGQQPLRFRLTARFAFMPHRTTHVPLFVSIACGAPARGCTTPLVPCTVAQVCSERGLTCSSGGRCVMLDPPPESRDGSADGCVPSCEDRMCGSNGCGGSCGNCAAGDACNSLGQCVDPTCVRNCSDRRCGSDGCGGTCGACESTQTCDAIGHCVNGPCMPNCTGRNCGSNGCGGTCGSCLASQVCSSAGQCSVPVCTPDCIGHMCGADGCGGSCGSCPGGWFCNGAATCQPSCTPSCAGRTCGNDGCGGSCGGCPFGELCDINGRCVSSCTPSCSGRNCGSDGCAGSCGSCPGGQSCNGAGQCVCIPNCAGRVCGDDGCGGSCGGCDATYVCDGSGQCACPGGQTVCADRRCAACCPTRCTTSIACTCRSGLELNNYCYDACGGFNAVDNMTGGCVAQTGVPGVDDCGGPCTTTCIDPGCTWNCIDGGPAGCPFDRGVDCGVPGGPTTAAHCVCN